MLHHGRNDSSGLAVNTTCSNPKKHETCLILLISYPIDSFSMPNLPCRLLKYLPIGIFFVYLFIRIYFLNKSLRVCTYTSLESPVLIGTLNGPLELFAHDLAEQFVNGHVKLFRKHDSKSRINIVELTGAQSNG